MGEGPLGVPIAGDAKEIVGRRPRWQVAAAAVLLAALATGCARAKGKAEAAPAPTRPAHFRFPVPPVPGPTRAYAGTTLVYQGEQVGTGSDFDLALAARFAADTGVRVKVVPMANSVTQVYAGYQRLFQARSPDIDVVMIDIIWPGALASHLVDLGPALGKAAQASLPANVRNNTVGGRLVAMPSYLGVGLLYYRKDLLARHGFARPPATWDELEHQARVILAAERPLKPRLAGYVWQGNVYEGLTCNALEWQVSHGGGAIFDAAGRPDVTNPGALAAFRRAASWVGGTSPVGVTAYMEEDARQVFQSGNAVFMRNWPYAYAAADAEGSPLRGKFGATALPAGPGGRSAGTLGGWEVGVSAYSRHRAAATELVRYLTCAEVQAWRAKERLFLPTIPALYHRADVVAAQPSLASMEAALDAAVARPSAVTRELYNEASAIYHEGIAEILQGGDPPFVAGKMQRDLEELVASRQEAPTARGGAPR